jgi:hypothetical protein
MADEQPTEPEADQDAPRAKGRALPRTDDDLDRLSRISRQDREAGISFWHNHAPAKFKGLIDATKHPE